MYVYLKPGWQYYKLRLHYVYTLLVTLSVAVDQLTPTTFRPKLFQTQSTCMGPGPESPYEIYSTEARC